MRESGRGPLNQTAFRDGSMMRALASIAPAALLSVSGPVLAQDVARQRERNAPKGIEANQRQQTEMIGRQAQRDGERAWRQESARGNDRVNAQRDARST